MSQAAGPLEVDREGSPPAEAHPSRWFGPYKWAVGLAAAVLQSLIYFGIGHSQRPRSTTLLDTALDRAIPFVPWTVWLYLPFYAAIFLLTIGGLSNRRLFDRTLRGVLCVMAVGAAGHLLVGAEYPRPPVRPPMTGRRWHFSAGCSRSIRRAMCSRRCTSPTARRWRSSCATTAPGWVW